MDFETTGLLSEISGDPAAQPGIVQIGIVALNQQFEEIMVIDQLINPEIEVWDPGAIATHGIQPEQVKEAPNLYEYFSTLARAFCGRSTWIGFNNSFDQGVLWYQLLRYGLEKRMPWPFKEIDVMKASTEYANMEGKRGVKPPRLVELHSLLFGEPHAKAHDALADVRATIRCLRALVEKGIVRV